MKEKVVRISMSLPEQLLKSFEEASKRLGFKDRSKAIQAAMRDLIAEQNLLRERDVKVVGAILTLYDHTSGNVEEYLTDVEHKFASNIVSSLHIHLDERLCFELIAVKGNANRLANLIKRVRKAKGIKQIKFAYVVSEQMLRKET
jgi:CopG family nickel-responsive transcriptional regulator